MGENGAAERGMNMAIRKFRKFGIAIIVASCMIMLGFGAVVPDGVAHAASTSGKRVIGTATLNPGAPIVKGPCNNGEQWLAEERVCALPLECDNARECLVWSEQLIKQLAARYGSFLDPVAEDDDWYDDWYEDDWYEDDWYEDDWYDDWYEDYWYGDYRYRHAASDDDGDLDEEDFGIVAEYRIVGNRLALKASSATEKAHQALWEHFAWIVPAKERQMLTKFKVFSNEDYLAYVVQDKDDWRNWELGILEAPFSSPNELVGTIIHEFGHLLTLNAKQANPYASKATCKTFYSDDGCFYSSAYLPSYLKQFWPNPDQKYAFDEYRFVSEYAATSYVEDIAETWTAFVLEDWPKGNRIVDQKVAFFANYDELVMLRAELLSRVATWLSRHG